MIVSKLNLIQQEYVDRLLTRPHVFVDLPMGIGVTDIILEIAKLRKRNLVVVCPLNLAKVRKWGEGVRIFTLQQIRKTPIEVSMSDLVYIDVGVSGRATLHLVLNLLSSGCDFIWRV